MQKFIYSEPFKTTRDLVKFVNNNEIPREDIVTILLLRGEIMLIYYK